MNIVILHCHFERGGVTQVVENHVRALREDTRVGRILLVSGDRKRGLSEDMLATCDHVSIPGFDYDEQEYVANELVNRQTSIGNDLERRLAEVGIAKDSSVLHWHNHSLGKNTAAAAVVRRLAECGWRILLQIHDFAEDNRPENYRRIIQACGAKSKADVDRFLYPVASQVHYATLTRADRRLLLELGIPRSRTHWLPNSVSPPSQPLPGKAESLGKVRRVWRLPFDARWSLYPVRGIRRKNIGELLLLSRLTGPEDFFGLTLKPATPIENRSYERWKELARRVAPTTVFDAAHQDEISYAENLAAADHVVSTSVAEGFGMALLEPWLSDREVIARDLPTVTDDFRATGVRLPKFYARVAIPGDRDWLCACRKETRRAAELAWSGLPERFRPAIDEVGDEVGDGAETMDFAKLTPARQIEVLERMSRDPGFELAIAELGREILDTFHDSGPDSVVQQNKRTISKQYSVDGVSQSLVPIYNALAGASLETEVDAPQRGGIAVDNISRARPFFPCRTETL